MPKMRFNESVKVGMAALAFGTTVWGIVAGLAWLGGYPWFDYVFVVRSFEMMIVIIMGAYIAVLMKHANEHTNDR